jgi:hypothetical protein
MEIEASILFPFPCGMKFNWIEERRNRQIVPFSHDACGCWKQLIRRLLPEGTKG